MNRECFAYRNGKCVILSELVCKNGPCPFASTSKQAREAREKAKRSLSERGLVPVVKKKDGVQIQTVRRK